MSSQAPLQTELRLVCGRTAALTRLLPSAGLVHMEQALTNIS